MTNDPHQFTRDAWEANAEVWDVRMGDEGNDFFKTPYLPVSAASSTLQTYSHLLAGVSEEGAVDINKS